MEDTERLCDYLSVADHIVHEWEVSVTESIDMIGILDIVDASPIIIGLLEYSLSSCTFM